MLQFKASAVELVGDPVKAAPLSPPAEWRADDSRIGVAKLVGGEHDQSVSQGGFASLRKCSDRSFLVHLQTVAQRCQDRDAFRELGCQFRHPLEVARLESSEALALAENELRRRSVVHAFS